VPRFSKRKLPSSPLTAVLTRIESDAFNRLTVAKSSGFLVSSRTLPRTFVPLIRVWAFRATDEKKLIKMNIMLKYVCFMVTLLKKSCNRIP
jgi:hypothetical protein